MIIYGDPEFPSTLADAALRIQEAAARTEDELRFLTILCGQAEQAASDCIDPGWPGWPASDAAVWRTALRECTDLAARALVRLRADGNAPEFDAHIHRILAALPHHSEAHLTVKVPEGYAFYSLYPEQYQQAAEQWAADHPEAREIAVVGILSIGSSLSAIVQAALTEAGKEARRFTVRPVGHPFDRRAAVDPAGLEGAEWALIVDEGPGLSGSSMASTAAALVQAGMDPGRISFLPGHAGDPGSAGTPETRAWWLRAPRHVALSSEIRWQGRSLSETLSTAAAALTGIDVLQVQDLGGGLWREAAYSEPRQWPAVIAPFERAKFRCAHAGGRSTLLKFAGLAAVDDSWRPACELDFERQARLAEAGWTPRPLGTALGFVASPWVEGRRLTRGDVTPALLRRIAAYIGAAAGQPLDEAEASTGQRRLTEICYWNLREALDEPSAAEARRRIESLKGLDLLPRYGDGRMAPHEWVLTSGGKVLKTNVCGHDRDHTVIGRQSLLWDVAGVIVEWDLDREQAAAVTHEVRALEGKVNPAAVEAYCLSYGAFRLGMCVFCAGCASGEDRRRLEKAAEYYRTFAARLLRAKELPAARSPRCC